MRTFAILLFAVAACMWVIDRPAQAAPAEGGGTAGSSGAAASGSASGQAANGAAQGQATSGSAGPTDLNMNNPAELNPMQPTNPAGENPATSTQGAISNPPGNNAPRTLQDSVNRAGSANAQMRQDLRDDRQNFRQDFRTQRQDNRMERLNNPNRWRYTLQNGEWWYWLPSNSWVYWRDNRWMPYSADTYQPFGYRTGYRGASSPAYFYDETGRRYRRDYSPLRPQNMETQTGTSSGSQSGMQAPTNSSGELNPMNHSPQSNEGGIGP